MHVDRCRTRRDYVALLDSDRFDTRWKLEEFLAELHAGQTRFTLPGVCDVCRRSVRFTVTFANAWRSPYGNLVPNWREALLCPHCRMNGRQRMIARLAASAVARHDRDAHAVYVMEDVSPIHRSLRSWFPEVHLTTSEYFGPDVERGSVVRGVRHEDAERLTFADESFDLFVSCDVFEHVNEPARAFGEAHRVLRPGGRAILTFPMDLDADGNRTRARVEDGALRTLEPPVFHTNTVAREGSLVFTDFGWEVLDQLRAAGFHDPTLDVYWSYELGYLGVQFYVDAAKPPADPPR